MIGGGAPREEWEDLILLCLTEVEEVSQASELPGCMLVDPFGCDRQFFTRRVNPIGIWATAELLWPRYLGEPFRRGGGYLMCYCPR